MKTLIKILSAFKREEKIRFFCVVATLVSSSLVETITLMLLIPYIGIISQDPRTLSYFPASFSQTELFIGFTLFFISFMLLKSFLQLVSNYQIAKFPYHYYRVKTGQLFQKYLNQNYASFINEDTGTFIKHCTQTCYHATQAINHQLHVLSYFFITVFLFAAILIQDFWGSLAIITLFGLTALLIFQFNKKPLKKLGGDLNRATKNAYQCALEALHLFKEVKIYGKSPFFVSKFDHDNQLISQNFRRKEFLSMVPPVLIELMAVIILLIVVVYVYFHHEVTSHFVAGLIFYAAVGRRILPAINHMTQQAIYLHHSLESLLVFEEQIKNTQEEPASKEIKVFRREISFRNISFSYQKDLPILDRVSFDIPLYGSVAFVGPSGGGKSTIIDLLIGLLHPNSGDIYIDGKLEPNMMPYQNQIGYVPQSIALINDTIERNIALGEETVDEKRLSDVLEASHLKEFVASLPKGVETYVGDKGIKVSGGQMQRIGIARALYHQPDLIIFDEATSSLDNLSELVIAESIKEMMGKKTVVAVAHRLSSIKNFDCIYVLDQGKIIAKGTHAELVKSCPLYQTLNRLHEKVS